MKIGIVTNLYPPYVRGGAEHVVVRTVEALLERGHDTFVVTGMPRKKGRRGIAKGTTAMERIYRFFPKNFYFVLNDHRHPWVVRLLWHVIDALCSCGANNVYKVMQEERPDVMVTHNLKGIGLRIPRAIQAEAVPHVHVVHDLQLIYPSGLLFAGKERIPWHTKPFYAVYGALCRWLMGQPDLVIFPSVFLRDAYLERGFFQNTDVKVMPNPAPRFDAIKRSTRQDGPLTLLFVGQLETHKGILFLLNAFRAAQEKNIRLIIAGEGTCSRTVQNAAVADERITYLGYVAIDQLIHCLSLADALVVPSLCYENSPTVIYEGLQAGVPVLAADIGGVGELVQDGKNGFLFTPNSQTDFLRALKAFDAKKDHFMQHQEAIQKTVAPHALSVYADKLDHLLKGVIARKEKS